MRSEQLKMWWRNYWLIEKFKGHWNEGTVMGYRQWCRQGAHEVFSLIQGSIEPKIIMVQSLQLGQNSKHRFHRMELQQDWRSIQCDIKLGKLSSGGVSTGEWDIHEFFEKSKGFCSVTYPEGQNYYQNVELNGCFKCSETLHD